MIIIGHAAAGENMTISLTYPVMTPLCRRASKNAARTKPATASRLQRTLKPTEADLLAENPTFIGLISLLTGSSDLQEIQITARRLYRRGSDILGTAAKTHKNAPSV
jgi:hypothetical protein